jgi:hypothetical protein
MQLSTAQARRQSTWQFPEESARETPRRCDHLGTGPCGPKRMFVMDLICAAHGCMADPRAASKSFERGTGAAAPEVLFILLEMRIRVRARPADEPDVFVP